MKYASDFRTIARNALRGKWLIAALTAFVASLIGALILGGRSGGATIENESNSGFSFQDLIPAHLLPVLLLVFGLLAALASVGAVVAFLIGGVGKLGYAKFNLNVVDRREARFEDLFSQFNRFGDGFLMNFLAGLYIFLWSLLFIIPGIIKFFSYAMTPYILYEHPEYTPNQAITRSRELMNGNKFRLFCLSFSFIGWSLLCMLPTMVALIAAAFGAIVFLPLMLVTIVGECFLSAYIEAAGAAFYREISQTEAPAFEADYTVIQ
ncbi:MAG: DUF975 family protein [Ruminococcaceae bacterium]|nr:DUF975 family protein [Oscillospiraceae bacterium]